MRQPTSVTVIIATYNRAALLNECLDHLRVQPFQPGDEVIVVDNGSTDDTDGIDAAQQTRFPVPVHLLHETVPGKSRAIASFRSPVRLEKKRPLRQNRSGQMVRAGNPRDAGPPERCVNRRWRLCACPR